MKTTTSRTPYLQALRSLQSTTLTAGTFEKLKRELEHLELEAELSSDFPLTRAARKSPAYQALEHHDLIIDESENKKRGVTFARARDGVNLDYLRAPLRFFAERKDGTTVALDWNVETASYRVFELFE